VSNLIGAGFTLLIESSFELNLITPCLKIWNDPLPRSFASNSGASTAVSFSFGDYSFLVSALTVPIFY